MYFNVNLFEFLQYGDFLQCLGSAADDSYTKESQNVVEKLDGLAEMRKNVFDSFKNFPCVALVLNKSAFHHIGTMQELLQHLSPGSFLFKNFHFSSVSYSYFNSNEAKNFGCVMQSFFAENSQIGRNSVIEFSHFSSSISIGSKCLLL